jgi:ATP-dependent DNA helicase RecG
VQFHSLAFVVVDEQHRFGVEQRAILEQTLSVGTAIRPHVLNMTATPIPRTLSLVFYGDQDVSILNEYPAGRKPIFTKIIKSAYRNEAYDHIRTILSLHQQIYWISPLVEESEALDVANATNMQELLRAIFPEARVGLIHGKMKSADKEAIMQAFYRREIDILSSTSVIEVGVNNPNATVMCIEGAERF